MEFTFDFTVDRQHTREAAQAMLSTIFFYRVFGSIEPHISEFLETPYPRVDVPEITEEIERQLDLLMARIDSDLETPILSSASTTPFGSPGAHFNLNTITQTANPYANIKFDDTDPSSQQQQQQQQQQQASLPPDNSSTLSNSRTLRKSPLVQPKEPSIGKEYRFAQVQVKFHERRKLKKPSWFGKLEEDVLWETWTLNLRVYKKTPDTDSIFFQQLNDKFSELIWKISDAVNENKDHIPIITSPEVMPFVYTIAVTGSDGWKGFIKKMLSDPTL